HDSAETVDLLNERAILIQEVVERDGYVAHGPAGSIDHQPDGEVTLSGCAERIAQSKDALGGELVGDAFGSSPWSWWRASGSTFLTRRNMGPLHDYCLARVAPSHRERDGREFRTRSAQASGFGRRRRPEQPVGHESRAEPARLSGRGRSFRRRSGRAGAS